VILQSNQRGGARNLALHLLKDENEHVEVHEIRGFVSGDLVSALKEAQAISRGTKAKQFLFSLSLNPPPRENVSTADFKAAIVKSEEKLGLTNQPRAIVFHEKEGRRHCHAVWSRIDAKEMRAIPLSFSKLKLMEVSKELYLQHGWTMPRGMMNTQERDPRNFTLAEWQQAKRIGKDQRAIKQVFQECWVVSDNQSAFQTALRERGYLLARGDRRGFVALDHRCEVFSVLKWTSINAKSVRARLTDAHTLPSVDEAKMQIANDMQTHLVSLQEQQDSTIKARMSEIEEKRVEMKEKHERERQLLLKAQQKRWRIDSLQRQAQLRTGLRGLMDRVTGKHGRIKKRNEREAYETMRRDQCDKDELIFKQMAVRRSLQRRIERLQQFQQQHGKALSNDVAQYREI